METLESLGRRIESASELRSVVKTMKSLAAVNITHFQEATRSLHDYLETVEMGLQVALQGDPQRVQPGGARPGTQGLGAIVVGSDQGMCGRFNEEVAEFAVERMRREDLPLGQWRVVALGARIVGSLEDAGIDVEGVYPIPASLSGISQRVETVIAQARRWYAEDRLTRVMVYHAETVSQSSYEPVAVQLLPINPQWVRELLARPWPGPTIPTFRAPWPDLIQCLLRQAILVLCFRAITESLASENITRLQSMEAAESNIGERLAELKSAYNRERQSSITAEILDIVGGFEALKEDQ
jgi:F-type H+-transporting ATPase subunit gamma